MNIKYILIGLLVAVAGILFFYKYKKEGIKLILTQLIVKAEFAYKSKEGQAKKQWVIDEISKLIPFYLKWLISKETISNMIEFILSTLQETFRKI